MQEMRVQSLGQEDPWKWKWHPTPVILPGKSHEQRSLAGYSPWGCKRVRNDLVTKQHKNSFVRHDDDMGLGVCTNPYALEIHTEIFKGKVMSCIICF